MKKFNYYVLLCKFILVLVFAFVLTGCLSIIRIPVPHNETYSEDGTRHVDYYESMLTGLRKDCPAARGLYPTIRMRVHATKMMYQPITPDLKGEELYRRRMSRNWGWIPLTVLWLTSPVDAVVDTIAIPWDW